MSRNTLFVAVGLTVVVAFAGAANAVVTAWGPPTTISGDTDVSTSGTFKAAFHNYTGAPGTDWAYIVNGVTFNGWGMGGALTASNNGVTFTLDAGVGSFNAASSVAPFVDLSASYRGLLTIAGGGYRNFTMTLSGLTDGHEYAFQWWTDDSRGVSGDRTTTATTGATSVLLDENSSNADGGVGQYAIGTFAADSTGSLAIAFSAPSDWQALNAFQLRDLGPVPVPEPATLALLAFGGVGLLARRRRKA